MAVDFFIFSSWLFDCCWKLHLCYKTHISQKRCRSYCESVTELVTFLLAVATDRCPSENLLFFNSVDTDIKCAGQTKFKQNFLLLFIFLWHQFDIYRKAMHSESDLMESIAVQNWIADWSVLWGKWSLRARMHNSITFALYYN